MRESAALGPCGGSNGDQQGIDLQTAQQHGTGKNQLGERGESGIIAAGGDDAKARADILIFLIYTMVLTVYFLKFSSLFLLFHENLPKIRQKN